MTIKKVVMKDNVLKNITFNEDSVYIWHRGGKDFLKLIKIEGTFKWGWLSNSTETVFDYYYFTDVIENAKVGDLYILDNIEQVIRLLTGQYSDVAYCEWKIDLSNKSNNDEISISECTPDKIYATYTHGTISLMTVVHTHNDDAFYAFTCLHSALSGMNMSTPRTFTSELIDVVRDFNVYQFDTTKEFLEWSLDKINE